MEKDFHLLQEMHPVATNAINTTTSLREGEQDAVERIICATDGTGGSGHKRQPEQEQPSQAEQAGPAWGFVAVAEMTKKQEEGTEK